MPECVGDDFEGHAHSEQQRRTRVPKLTDAPMPESGRLAYPRYGLAEDLRIQRRADGGSEDQVRRVAPDPCGLALLLLPRTVRPQGSTAPASGRPNGTAACYRLVSCCRTPCNRASGAMPHIDKRTRLGAGADSVAEPADTRAVGAYVQSLRSPWSAELEALGGVACEAFGGGHRCRYGSIVEWRVVSLHPVGPA